MTHDELLAKIDSFSCCSGAHEVALRAVIEACKSWENQRVIPISYILGAIEKELNG